MNKNDIIRTLEKRAEHFEKKHHSYEAREINSAIDTIERLMPPELLDVPVVVSSFLDKIKYSDSRTLLEMKELNQKHFAEWCAINPHAGADDEWDNDLMFMRDVAKYAENTNR